MLKAYENFNQINTGVAMSPELYLAEAGRAAAQAELSRETASRLESNGAGLRTHLSRSISEFTPEVWASFVARTRAEELAEHQRQLRRAHDDLDTLVFELRRLAQDSDHDAAYFMQQHRAALLEVGPPESGPS